MRPSNAAANIPIITAKGSGSPVSMTTPSLPKA